MRGHSGDCERAGQRDTSACDSADIVVYVIVIVHVDVIVIVHVYVIVIVHVYVIVIEIVNLHNYDRVLPRVTFRPKFKTQSCGCRLQQCAQVVARTHRYAWLEIAVTGNMCDAICVAQQANHFFERL